MTSEYHFVCNVCGTLDDHKLDCPAKWPLGKPDQYTHGEEDEADFLAGVTCNPDAPEECESCQ